MKLFEEPKHGTKSSFYKAVRDPTTLPWVTCILHLFQDFICFGTKINHLPKKGKSSILVLVSGRREKDINDTKDPRFIVDHKLNKNQHCNTIAKKQTSFWMYEQKCCTQDTRSNSSTQHRWDLNWSKCVQLPAPHFRKETKLEKIQRKATKMSNGQENITYKERLKKWFNQSGEEKTEGHKSSDMRMIVINCPLYPPRKGQVVMVLNCIEGDLG